MERRNITREKEFKLKVADARQRDVTKGIARIDPRYMKQIGVDAGEYIEIIGKKKTVGAAWPCYDADKNKDIIRIDNFIRKNADLRLGQQALVRRVEVENGEKVVLAPIDMRLNVDEDFVNFVQKRLDGRVLVESNFTIVMMLGHAIPFNVVRTLPHDAPVMLTSNTNLTIMGRPFPPPKLRLETPTDIKYLLRFDWLNNLVARIKGKKIVFSIPDKEISYKDEQKVLDAALKIAYDEMSNVRIEVNVKSNGTIIGTLPWSVVDMYGRISAIYPDIQIPPPSPGFVPRVDNEKVIPPMKRCFKTGVKTCPKEINFSPKSVVVAMPFRDEFQDTYKYAIRPALEEADFKPWKADEQISNIDVMCKICQAVQESGYLLANITTWNPNVVFELGLAYGLARNVILIKHKKAEVPVDLKGLEYIEYGTIDELKRNLLLFLKGAATAD